MTQSLEEKCRMLGVTLPKELRAWDDTFVEPTSEELTRMALLEEERDMLKERTSRHE